MIIGIPKEIKTRENRVSVTPEGVRELVHAGNRVIVETGAGKGSGFEDDLYTKAGAIMETTARVLWSKADMIVKVKEPVLAEYDYFRPDLTLFTYLHLAADATLTQRLLTGRVTAVAYETVRLADGSLPLLIPMSEIAGKIGAQEAAVLLCRHHGGKGILMGGAAGISPARVMVIGAGASGKAAAKTVAGIGGQVTIFDINEARLSQLSHEFGNTCKMMLSTPENIRNALCHADVVIGCILIPGAKSPKIITREMLAVMEPGSVLVDIAIDQGGCFETSRPTTHDNPTFVVDGIIHYCVANMPGATPRTSTLALSKATLGWIQKIAAATNPLNAIMDDPALREGLNTCRGYLTSEPVARALKMGYTYPLERFL
jgi:alanine dehydrogenase